MDTELAEALSDLKEGLGRIDERTVAIHDAQENLADTLKAHEQDNRSDFRGVHLRVNKIEKKQSWMIGIGTAVVGMITAVGSFFTGLFGG